MPRPRILILESYLPMGQALAVILRRAGWDVTLSQTDQNALQALRRNAYDVLLVDLDMPPGDGCRVLQNVASVYNPSSIIAIVDQEGDQIQRARSLGVNITLSKPVERERLLASTMSVLEHTRGC